MSYNIGCYSKLYKRCLSWWNALHTINVNPLDWHSKRIGPLTKSLKLLFRQFKKPCWFNLLGGLSVISKIKPSLCDVEGEERWIILENIDKMSQKPLLFFSITVLGCWLLCWCHWRGKQKRYHKGSKGREPRSSYCLLQNFVMKIFD